MVTEEVTINRNQIWLSYENVLQMNDDNLLESVGFVCYFSKEMPVLLFGESLKDQNGDAKHFATIEAAKEFANATLKNKLYPPYFLDPLSYEIGNIGEIMNKPMSIEIGQTSEDIEEIVEGKIIRCTSASNNRNLLAYIQVEKENGETQSYSIFELQKFKKPQNRP